MPAGLVGDTMDATLMLLVRGDTRGRGSWLDTGEGVLSPLTSWNAEFVGLTMLTAW